MHLPALTTAAASCEMMYSPEPPNSHPDSCEKYFLLIPQVPIQACEMTYFLLNLHPREVLLPWKRPLISFSAPALHGLNYTYTNSLLPASVPQLHRVPNFTLVFLTERCQWDPEATFPQVCLGMPGTPPQGLLSSVLLALLRSAVWIPICSPCLWAAGLGNSWQVPGSPGRVSWFGTLVTQAPSHLTLSTHL